MWFATILCLLWNKLSTYLCNFSSKDSMNLERASSMQCLVYVYLGPPTSQPLAGENKGKIKPRQNNCYITEQLMTGPECVK